MSPGSLYNHMRRHSDVASFMCRFCAKLFHTAGQLKIHEKIHTQQKDFVCDVSIYTIFFTLVSEKKNKIVVLHNQVFFEYRI